MTVACMQSQDGEDVTKSSQGAEHYHKTELEAALEIYISKAANSVSEKLPTEAFPESVKAWRTFPTDLSCTSQTPQMAI